MLKFLLLLVILLIGWRLWHKRQSPSAKAPRAEVPPERMVACARCGLLMPESDSLAGGGRHYCCEAHRRAAESDLK